MPNNGELAVIPKFPIPEVPPQRADKEDIISGEMHITQYIFARIAEAWDSAFGVDDICKMTMVTTRLLKDRRDLLGIEHGSKSSKVTDVYFRPID